MIGIENNPLLLEITKDIETECFSTKIKFESLITIIDCLSDEETCSLISFINYHYVDKFTNDNYCFLNTIFFRTYFKNYDSFKKKWKVSQIVKFLTQEQLIIIGKNIISALGEYEYDFLAIKKLKKYLSPESKNELFVFNVSTSVKKYFEYNDFTGDWNQNLEGINIPLYFEYTINSMISDVNGVDKTLKCILKEKHKFDFSLTHDGLSYAEFLCKNIGNYFDLNIIMKVSKKFYKFIDKICAFEELSRSKILENSLDFMSFIEQSTCDFFIKRWRIEKSNYSPEKKYEILRELIIYFYSQKIIGEFKEDLIELKEHNKRNGILDSLELNHQEMSNYQISYIIKEFNKSGISLVSKKLTNHFMASFGFEVVHSNREVRYENGLMPSLLLLLKLEPLNYLFIDYGYLKVFRKEIPEKTSLVKNVNNIIKNGTEYKKQFIKHLPVFLRNNKGIKSFLNRSWEMESLFLEIIKESKSEKDFAFKIMGKSSSFAQKIVLENVLGKNKINYNNMYWLSHLTASGFNYDKTVSFITTNSVCYTISEIKDDFLILLRKVMSEDKIFNIIEKSTNRYHLPRFIDDTYHSLCLLEEKDSLNLVRESLKDCENFFDVHDKVSSAMKYIEQDDYELEQDLIKELDGKSLNHLIISIPKRNHELIEIGKSLHICVGDGYYGEKIVNKNIFIIALKNKENHYSHCIEVDRRTMSIIQASTKFNKTVGKVVLDKLMDMLGNLS